MTIAYIKSNTLRRTILIVCVPFLPSIFGGIAFVKALDTFIEEFRSQFGQGCGGIFTAIRDCWNGVDVARGERIKKQKLEEILGVENGQIEYFKDDDLV